MKIGTNNTLDGIAQGSTVYALGQTLSADSPVHPNYPPFTLALQYRHGDWWTPCDMTFASELIFTTGHTGTHVDGLGHCSHAGKLQNGVDAYEAQKGGRGLTSLGVETLLPTFCRGVVLDVAGFYGQTCLNDDHAITADDLQSVAAEQGTELLEGDAVLIRTGRGQFWDSSPDYYSPDRADPGPSTEAVDWLLEQGISITGSDTMAYEFMPPDLGDFGRGHISLLGAGVPIIENLNLEELCEAEQHEFLFILAPLKIVGGTASPANPLAVDLGSLGN